MILRIVRTLTYSVFGVLAVYTILLVQDVRREMSKVDYTLTVTAAAFNDAHNIAINTTRTEAELAGLLNETRHIAIDARAADKQQLAALDAITKRTVVLLDNLNGTTVAMRGAVDSLNVIGPQVVATLGGLSLDAHATMGATQGTLNAATADLNAPELHSSLASIASATNAGAGAMGDVHTETTLIVGKTREAFAPESKIKSILRMVFDGTLNAASLYYYLSH